MIGQTISHYKILEKLGEGGMGVVYKAQDLKLDRIVALKFLPSNLAADENDKKRFIHEAKAASSLDHPNICTIYEVDHTPDGELFLAMAFYEGAPLSEKIKQGPMKIDEALELAIQAAEGLQAAHEKGIVHRDIKSGNLMLTEKGQVKLMDFGLARSGGMSQLTKTGSTVGTVPYMSPEQARGEKLDHRTDIWSFGMVLYEMITGRLPFKSDYNDAVIYSILNQDPEPVTALRTGVPMELERIIRKCLEKKSGDRYQHVEEVIVDLRKVRVGSKTDVQRIPTAQRFHWNRWYLAGGVILLLVALLVLFFPKSKTSEDVIHSIAVLPLENLSGDPEQEYFADGMTEALITDLAKISALRVISRTSVMHFKATQKTVPEIAKELNVDAIVEGSVQRVGDRVRITAQLLHAPTDRHLWAESYERNMTDVLALQSEVALAVAKEIRAKVTPQEETHLTSARPVNKEAYDLYLKGRYFWNKRTEEGLKKGIEHFKQAIEKDPGYPLAYAGLADSYYVLAYYSWLPPKEAYPKARAAALKALELDDSLAEGHAALASVKRDFDWDWVEAEKQFRRAFELNPSYAYAHLWCANLFNALGRREEALTEMKKALELDPLSLIINADLGRTFYFARQYDQSLEQFRKTLDMDPNFAIARLWLGQVYEQRRMYETAISEFQKGISLSGGSTYALARLGHAYAVGGRRVEAQMVLNQLNDLSKQKYVSPYDIAVIYAGMGEKNQAFTWLGRAYDERSLWLTFLKVDPSLDPLRSDPRFTELLKKIGLQPSESDNTSSLPSIEKPKTEASPKWQNSIAVLPFKNISSDKEQEYFCDGMTEQLITNLSNLPNVKVIARTSVMQFKNTGKTIQQIANELGVVHVLEGSVRKAGNKIRVTAQLIKADDGFHLWANDYDRQLKDIFAVQDDVSNAIVEALKINLTSGQKVTLTKRSTDNTEAYQLYLQGRFHWNQRTEQGLLKAIEFFEQALQLDPKYAPAYTGIADCYSLLPWYGRSQPKEASPKARAAALKALAIDPNLGEAYCSLAAVEQWYEWNWPAAEKNFKRAIELSPNYATGYQWYGSFLGFHGVFDKAIAMLKRALELDPLSHIIINNYGDILYWKRDYDEAIKQYQKAIDISPEFSNAHEVLGRAYLQKGMYQKAVEEFEKAGATEITQAYMALGKSKDARGVVEKLLKQGSKQKHLDSFRLALAYIGLGDKDLAFDYLEKARLEGLPHLVEGLKVDPYFDPLRTDPRFASLLRKVGLDK